MGVLCVHGMHCQSKCTRLRTDAAVPALVMHFVTASIYAYHFKGNRQRQFATCFVVHAVFNGIIFLIAPTSTYYIFLFLTFMGLTNAAILLLPSTVWRTARTKRDTKS